MTNPQHEALVEAVARAIGIADGFDPDGLIAYAKAGRREAIEEWGRYTRRAIAAIAALSATAATPSDEVVRLRGMLAALHYECLSFARHEGSPFDLAMTRAEAEFGNLRARAALEPQGKDV